MKSPLPDALIGQHVAFDGELLQGHRLLADRTRERERGGTDHVRTDPVQPEPQRLAGDIESGQPRPAGARAAHLDAEIGGSDVGRLGAQSLKLQIAARLDVGGRPVHAAGESHPVELDPVDRIGQPAAGGEIDVKVRLAGFRRDGALDRKLELRPS